MCASELQQDEALCFDESAGPNTKNEDATPSLVAAPAFGMDLRSWRLVEV